MAPHKLDNKIKGAFEERIIEPSGESWETLNKRLDQNVEKSSKRLYYILAFAATFVGVLLCVTLIFKTESPQIIVDTIEIPTETKTVENNNKINKIEKGKLELNTEQTKAEKATRSESSTNRVAKIIETPSVFANSKSAKTQKREPITLKKNTSVKTIAVLEATNAIPDRAISVGNDNKTYSAHEAEELLVAAQHKLALQQVVNKPRILDYNGLLNEVEDDLEETLRDKMLKTIKSSYYTVKGVVAERNE